jgi:hypothetical protein
MFVRQQAGLGRLAPHGVKKALATSPASRRSRFLLKVVCDQIGSSILRPTNQRYRHAVVDLFHQEPFTADRVERPEQQRPQQLLGRDQRATDVGVHRREPRRQLGEHPIRHRPNNPQRVIGAHALLRREVTEHVIRLVVGSTHPATPLETSVAW